MDNKLAIVVRQILRDNPEGVAQVMGRRIEATQANADWICSSIAQWDENQMDQFFSLHPAYEMFSAPTVVQSTTLPIEPEKNSDFYYQIFKSKVHAFDLIFAGILVIIIILIFKNGKN
jgi:hypothetical protein